MNIIISFLILIFGVALIVIGLRAMDSFSSDISRFFTGTPTDKAVWMLIGGSVLFIVGMSGIVWMY